MSERLVRPNNMLSPEREALFNEVETKLQFPIEVYRLGDRFAGLPRELAPIVILDVTKGRGCHYGVRNVFVPTIHDLEGTKIVRKIVSPETAILVESSSGNGWIAFSDAADALGYEHVVVMPDGLPEPRYKHPLGRDVEIIRTPKEKYVEGMPEALENLMKENRHRVRRGEMIYASPDHSVARADITVQTMSEIGHQFLEKLRQVDQPLRIVLSMGNGASICAVGGYLKDQVGAKVVATESPAYGGGYDRFAKNKGLPSYRELFGIDPGHPELMAHFSAYGTNAPFGKELVLQIRAMDRVLNDYVLVEDDSVLRAFRQLRPGTDYLRNASDLPNRSRVPSILYDTYGNSTLANIVAASRYIDRGELVVAMAYDGRQNY